MIAHDDEREFTIIPIEMESSWQETTQWKPFYLHENSSWKNMNCVDEA